jgi:peptidoglycan/xylan/chitin deacetylase (PgdA/CDA1 family)
MGRLRQLAERIAHGVVSEAWLTRLARARGARGIAITYHTMPADRMDAQLDVLERFFDFTSTAQLVESAAEDSRAGRRLPVALTFDDGKRSNLTATSPVLQRRSVPATFFVTTEPARSGALHWFDLADRVGRVFRERGAFEGGPQADLVAPLREIARRTGAAEPEVRSLRVLKRVAARERDALLERLAAALALPMQPADDDECSLSPDEVGELVRRGFTVGSHTCTHPILTREPEERVRAETMESRRLLAEWVGAPIDQFAYPNGNSSDTTERCTREAGYSLAFTTRPTFLGRAENPHRLPRIELVPEYEGPEIVFKLLVGVLGGLPNPDGTGYEWRRQLRPPIEASPG